MRRRGRRARTFFFFSQGLGEKKTQAKPKKREERVVKTRRACVFPGRVCKSPTRGCRCATPVLPKGRGWPDSPPGAGSGAAGRFGISPPRCFNTRGRRRGRFIYNPVKKPTPNPRGSGVKSPLVAEHLCGVTVSPPCAKTQPVLPKFTESRHLPPQKKSVFFSQREERRLALRFSPPICMSPPPRRREGNRNSGAEPPAKMGCRRR